jgi:uncharacterized membrane protein YkoI
VNHPFTKAVGSCAAVAVLAIGGAAPALAAKHRKSHSSKHKTSNTTTSGGSSETVLTGTNLSSASAAALTAVPGGTVTRASTENDSSSTSAAYEVHVTKSDGSRVVVIEDSSFAVLSTTAERAHGRGGPGGNGETPLTGTALSSASAAALTAVPGGTVDRASIEKDSSNTSAAYEVHVTKSDGSRVLVIEDSSFAVLSTTAEPARGPGGGRDHGGPGGPRG